MIPFFRRRWFPLWGRDIDHQPLVVLIPGAAKEEKLAERTRMS